MQIKKLCRLANTLRKRLLIRRNCVTFQKQTVAAPRFLYLLTGTVITSTEFDINKWAFQMHSCLKDLKGSAIDRSIIDKLNQNSKKVRPTREHFLVGKIISFKSKLPISVSVWLIVTVRTSRSSVLCLKRNYPGIEDINKRSGVGVGIRTII